MVEEPPVSHRNGSLYKRGMGGRNARILDLARWTALVTSLAAICLTAATCNKNPSAAPAPVPAAASAAVALPSVDAGSPQGKGDPAQVLADVPGLDFSPLPAPAQRELATVFTDEFCYCGCPHSLGACLKQHGGCRHAKRMALLAAGEAADGTPAVEIIVALSKYYQSFREPRSSFTVDDRLCQGPKDAKLTLVEFSDFECPYCAAIRPMLAELVKARTDLRVCYKPFPLSGHAHAMPAGQAALFARDHGKFWQMHDALFENQTALSVATIKQLATKLGLDAAALGKAIDSGKYLDELNASKEAGKTAGVDATPSIYVNGRKLTLAPNPAALAHTLDDELEWLTNKSGWAAD